MIVFSVGTGNSHYAWKRQEAHRSKETTQSSLKALTDKSLKLRRALQELESSLMLGVLRVLMVNDMWRVWVPREVYRIQAYPARV